MIERWAELDVDGLFQYAENSSRQDKRQIYHEAFTYLAATDPARALSEFGKIEDRRTRLYQIYTLSGALAEEYPNEVLKILEEVPENWGGQYGSFFRTVAESDPGGAAIYLERIERQDKRREAIEAISSTWTGQNAAAAKRWIDSLSGSDKTVATRSYLGKLAQDDPQKALRIAESMPPGSRGNVLSGVVCIVVQG